MKRVIGRYGNEHQMKITITIHLDAISLMKNITAT